MAINTAVGVPFAYATCTTPLCVVGVELAANYGGSVAEDLMEPTMYENANQYDNVATALKEAINNPATKDSLTVSMTYQNEIGSLVYFDENTQYLETNPNYRPEQYVLRIEGASQPIILTPSQAIYINSILGGGLLP